MTANLDSLPYGLFAAMWDIEQIDLNYKSEDYRDTQKPMNNTNMKKKKTFDPLLQMEQTLDFTWESTL